MLPNLIKSENFNFLLVFKLTLYRNVHLQIIKDTSLERYREKEVISKLKQRTQELDSTPHHLDIFSYHVPLLAGEINSGSP